MLWKMALKEIRYNRLFSFLFLFNVAIGLLGLVTIENFKVSFEQVLGERAKNLLGADIALSSRFPLTKEKREKFHSLVKGENYSETNLLTMFSMGKGSKSSRLVFLHTLTNPSEGAGFYPYYGWIELDGKEKFPEERKSLPGKYELWAYPEVIQQLGSKEVRIGTKDFKIVSIVTDDSQQTFEMGSVAPKLFINLEDAKEAGLIQKGSTLRYYTLVKTDVPITEQLVTELNEELDDNAINVSTPEKSSQQVGRVLAYLSDFLGLVSLVALFLASVGLFYLYRSHLGSKRLSFGLYSALGLKQNQIFGLYFRQVFLLGLGGSLLGLFLSALIIPSINFFLSYVLPFELPALVSPRALIIGLSVGILGVLLLSYPLILGAVKQKPASLFQEVAEIGQGKFNTSTFHFLPYILFFAVMSFYASQSFKVGGLFLLIFSGATLLSFPLGIGLLRIGKRVSENAGLRLKLSLRYLNRYWISTISIFLSLLLGCMLLNLIPMLEQSISQELQMGKQSNLPSLFLFDIQDEQVNELQSFFENNQKLNLLSLSPFIRSRIIKINDEEVKVDNEKALTREQQREQRFRNRGTNLSYRDILTESEEIIEGSPFPGPFQEGSEETPLISVEMRYAERMGIKLGDNVEFNILGVPILGKVHNIRKVRWTSFLPNFFIQFQSGVLNNAPKTWLAAVPAMEKERLREVQDGLFDKFPNVSAVDISRVVKKILSVMSQMGWALKAMSGLCLIVGFFVLYSLANHQMEGRKADMALLKVIGMELSEIRKMAIQEFVVIGAMASLLGSLFGMVVSFIVSKLFFDGLWEFNLLWPLGSLVLVSGLCFVTSFLATGKVLKMRSSYFLS